MQFDSMTNPSNPLSSVPAPAPVTPDPLAGLRDWHLPDPVSWWPPAPGWWLVAGLAAALLALVAVRWQRRRRQGAAGRAALRELQVLRGQLGAGLDQGGFTAAVSTLLRRLALTRFPRERVAGLSGDSWLAFLDATGGGDAFSRGPGRVLAEWPYRAPGGIASPAAPIAGPAAPDEAHDQADAQVLALADLAGRWIRASRGTVP